MKPLVYLTVVLAAVSAQPVVETSLGSVRGTIRKVTGIDVEAFLAIPFAKPPKGELRFALPIPFGDIGDFDATKTSTVCPQVGMMSPDLPNLVQDEDCLKLNIYRKPGTPSNAKKPVIISVYGGGYSVGSAVDNFQTAIALAAYEDVIVVSPNYRLGVLGFADTKGLTPANLGLHDQRLAFKWVHDNIEAFGGDPNRVTLMGVSAGSMSIGAQLITPLNKERLFHSVIMDAGVVNGYGYIEDSDTSFRRLQRVADKVNCPTAGAELLKCLKEKDAQDLVKAANVADFEEGLPNFVATRDGEFIPRDLEEYLTRNKFVDVRMMIGHAKNEGTLFTNPRGIFDRTEPPKLENPEEFVKWIQPFIKKYNYPIDLNDQRQRKSLVEEYYNQFPGTAQVTAEIQGDGIFVCPINYYVKEYAKRHNNVFVYQFNRKLQDVYFGFMNSKIFGAFHYSPYLHFSGLLLAGDNVAIDELDKQFFLDSMKMVSEFAESKDAPSFRGVTWPDYSQTEEVLILDETPKVRSGLTHEDKCKTFFVKPNSRKTHTEL